MQNCEEKIPTIDLTDLNEYELDYFLFQVSQVCDKIADAQCIVIKITRIETNE